MIEPYPQHLLKNILDKIRVVRIVNFGSIEDLEEEIRLDYMNTLRFVIFDYIMLDPAERDRLNIKTYPKPFFRVCIRAPVPWHQTVITNKQMIEHHLFIVNPVLVALRDLWLDEYNDMLIVPVSQLEDSNPFPLELTELESEVDRLCDESSDRLRNEWLPKCADIFLNMKSTWRSLVPDKNRDSLKLIESFFYCARILMSMQLRTLVMRSLHHILSLFVRFKGGNNFGEVYADYACINIPLVTVTVKASPPSTDLTFFPMLDDIRKFVHNCFSKILNVNSDIPCVECLLFSDMQDSGLTLYPVVESEREVTAIIQEALDSFDTNMAGPNAFLREYEPYLYILDGTAEKDVKDLFEIVPLPFLKDFAAEIEKLEEKILDVDFLRRTIPLNFISLNCAEVNDTMVNILSDLKNYITDFFVTKIRAENKLVCRTFEDICNRVSELPEKTAELVELTHFMIQSRDVTVFDLNIQILNIAENLLFIIDRTILPGEDIQLNSRVFNWPREIEVSLELANTRLSHRRDIVENALKNRLDELNISIAKHGKELDLFRRKDPPLLTMEEMEESAAAINDIQEKLFEDKVIANEINEEEGLLEFDLTPFTNLNNMLVVVEPFHRLWHTVLNFHKQYDKWYYGPFLKLDAEEIAEEVESTWRTLYKLAKTLQDTPGAKRIAEMVRAKVEKFRQYVPVLTTICNPGIQERHWEKLSEVVGVPLKPDENTSLEDMIEVGLPQHLQALEEIGVAATKEYALEKNLKKMKDEWQDMKFDLNLYRDSGVSILSAVDDIQMLLDDHILKAQTMRGSPYVKAFEADMVAWEEKLISMQDILDAWLTCQATWLYLEPIFSSEDIMRQMPQEAANFRKVDKSWRAIMANTVADRHVLIATDYPNMLELLRENNVLLEEIQKGLNDYLEKKRLFFPRLVPCIFFIFLFNYIICLHKLFYLKKICRFFFLSNDELLEILSETKDPMRVQPHLKKCFEGINRLEFNQDCEILSMISAESETVPLISRIQPHDAKGMVEKWLVQVEDLMVKSMRAIALDAVAAYFNSARSLWVLNWPGMIVLCGSTIHWTAEVSESITSGSIKSYLDKSNQQIDDMVELVRGKLSKGSRITVEALIVIDVHARDVVRMLVANQVSSLLDFNWTSQLRYYMKDSNVYVSMITTELAYGYEYLGNTGRLVITPLTDRCYRTLMGALRLNLGGAPEGPAGTGKTETSKDLAKAVAKQCVVFNCSDSLDYKAMGKFFKGLACSGAWACFDEFNRIEVEVLSVIAQQVLCIQMAIINKLEKFVFEGVELKLNPTCTIFITMNPGYAGRQELPDNLKVLFRTVAMMVPDYAMIGEISLYSMGFVNARSLSEKIVDTYKLCSEQLSSQSHYDYGMRAVKTVLTAAGNLKLKYPNEDESSLVLRAITDVNLPKFLSEDVPLFSGIISDLFPGIKLPKPDRDELLQKLQKNLEAKNLQATEWYVEKVIQLYEMILVRHGLMLVGDPMGGKTCAYKNLADSLSDLQSDSKSTMEEHKVNYRVINPKAITMGQLYGQFDPVSHEWSDGVLAKSFREFSSSLSADRKWILFDGPVDAVWIENMNTVLDDNKKLCLMSGEIIQMTSKMNMIFEPADLEQASPATVSRCGMIYMEPSKLGWQPLCKSFHSSLSSKILEEQFELIEELTAWIIPPTIQFVQNSCRQFVWSSELHMFQSYSRLLTCHLEGETQVSTVWLQCVFLFCVIWGFASTITGDSRKKFDTFFRHLLDGRNDEHPRPKTFKLSKSQLFPDKGTVFEWVFDKKNNGSWISWLDTMEKVSFPPSAKINELIIPTTESACQRYFLKMCLSNDVPILFVGPTGTGKSAIVLNHLMSLPKDKILPNVVNFSARTSANMTQEIVMSKLDRRRKGVYGPAMGKQYVLFVDDVSLPMKDTYGAQPPIELLRQWIDHRHWYNLKDTTRIDLVDILFVGAMSPPGGSSNQVTSRFLRHNQIVSIDSFENETLTKMFHSILEWHFAKGFSSDVSRYAKPIVEATMEIYHESMARFLPTPAKSHYTFNLRDFSRVIRGIILVPSSHLSDTDKLFRLWTHETYRVFYDRLIDDIDRKTFFDMIRSACRTHLRAPLEKVLHDLIPEGENDLKDEHLRDLFFGNYMDPDADPKIYTEVESYDLLVEKMQYYLNEYNLLSRTPMSLVLFKFAMEHISRISRVLQQDNGHCLLVGIGGSGRQSATKLATSMAEYGLFLIEINKNYGMNEWRDDIRSLLRKAGVETKPHVFLFNDSQIQDEAFIEDINMILNTGDVPNLFGSEDKADILEKMMSAAQSCGKRIDSTPLALYNYFVERVRNSLHLVLAMSPIGDSFRERIRMFPSLINCCTIDWFTTWPEDALDRVATVFLKEIEMDDKVRKSCVTLCKKFHLSVHTATSAYFQKTKRLTYVTPTSYLELLHMFKKLYDVKVEQISKMANRYEVGLEKLDFAAGQIALMKEELTQLQPQLIDTSLKTEKLMIKIEQDTVVVEAKKEIVAADEAVANEAAAAAQAIKDDCESDLAEAIPALESAIQALNTLKPADITVVKSLKTPPHGVRLVMEAVCVMKGIKSERRPDPSGSGRMIEDYWGPSQKILGDMKFLDSLKTYDKDNIPPSIMKRIRERYINDRDFDPAHIKNISAACEGLCRWVRAMEVYDRVIKIVEPKKAKLAEAEAELAVQMETLNEKRAQLQEVVDKLQALNDDFATMTRRKKELEDNIELCSQKIVRAEQLIGGLGGEKARWSDTAKMLHGLLENIVGDVLLSSGFTAYLGAFTVDFRNSIRKSWNQSCKQLNIPCSEEFSLIDVLGEPVSIRTWNIAGLPVDSFSVENGIIVTQARRWPLMIDPQGQANKWIKNMEKGNNLHVIKQSDPNFLRIVETAIQMGHPVILENILEDIDAALEPVLLKSVFKQGGIEYLNFGDNVIEYNNDFRLYITTRLRNPHYLPEVAVKVTLLNFMITPQGLQDQLLAIVVAKECPEMEERKNNLIIESADNKRQLKEIEDQILMVLSSSEGNILEDESAIQILTSSKVLSESIQAKQEVAVVTEKEIDQTRNMYIPVSTHSAVLFFCISELANIDPMYQYSLLWFINLYLQSINNSEKSDNLEKRMSNLNSYFTMSIYKNVCRSLFEKDKLIFSLVLCVGILRSKRRILEDLWTFLLTGGVALDNPYDNPDPSWLSVKSWSEIVRISNLPGMEEFMKSVQNDTTGWKLFYDSPSPQTEKPPSPYADVKGLQKLVILRALRPDKLVPAIQEFISNNLGQSFIEPPPFSLLDSYSDSHCGSPLVFILSPGADPMLQLLKFAEDRGIDKNTLGTISLGQGQGPIAAEMINQATKSGQWVVLQNCHLAESWMPELDRICEEVIVPEHIHKDFRCWLTSYPSKAFPVSVLQNGVKMTNEAPKGLRMNLMRSYMSDPINNTEFFNACVKQKEWRCLLFGLCFFHAVIQERRKFGPLGWNIPYEFNESDLRISVLQLQMFLNEYESVPFDALSYLTGECNYGGRVTDDKDRRLLLSLLSLYYNKNTIDIPKFAFSPSGLYYIPDSPDVESCLAYIKKIPLNPLPEVFGLHENADITKDNKETSELLHGALLTQTHLTTGGAGGDSDAMVIELAAEIHQKIPKEFDIVTVAAKYPIMYSNSMNTVLKQELVRFNRLIKVVKHTLVEVQRAVKGLVVMNSELEEVYRSMVVGRVPTAWSAKSYPSLKPLGGYISDLLARLKFFQDWITYGSPVVFWISGFFFTQSFLTGVLQNFARREKIPIDHLGFLFEITPYEKKAPEDPSYGVYTKRKIKTEEFSVFIEGLFLQGARWDRASKLLNDPLLKVMFDFLPVIWLKPGIKASFNPPPSYNCPVYKTSERRGILSTTGHSSNFVMFILLPSDRPENVWINGGVAALCALDD
ncbi:dynein axonemal heavy chain 3 [Frankliniella occidentalis]|uniref:Dynein axonemal heavy chain 3 n=1 Tax=Frankliniella occidentalis TaxID=133901 RepID=A0A9C6X809_FRAOC|nr:dynein axonemal heavy chain 3 [Frankliniella occidentalis]